MTIQYQGVWSLQSAAQLQSTQRWVTDPLFENTTLLLQADDAANGAQNNTFLDSSSNSFAITRNPASGPNAPTQGSFTPFSSQPGAWGNFFDGTDDFLQKTSPAAGLYDWTSTNWTLEYWIYANAFGQGTNTVSNVVGNATDGGSTVYWSFGPIASGVVRWYYYNGGSVNLDTSTVLSTGRWHHLAFVNNSNTLTVYVDGVASATAAKAGTPQFSSGTPFTIGKITGSSFNGYISNLRITQSAVYTANFTPSSIPLSPISGTQLMTCQSNRFLDNSTNAVVFTPSGTPSVQAFSPFAPQFQWTPSVIGGSGYFDGTGDFLSMSDNASFNIGANAFAIELWYYAQATAAERRFISQWDTGNKGIILTTENQTPRFYYSLDGTSDNSITSSATPAINQWNHLAVCRSGSTLSMFLNGARVATTTQSGTFFNATGGITIGSGISGGTPMNGYIAAMRSVIGSSPYDATQPTITVPTTPPTAITNTSLLLNFTNAGIYDGTMKNNLETVGNAQISTAVVKYGSGSMYFDGNGDYLYLPSNRNLELGTGDFTLECWVYATSAPSDVGIFESRTDGNGATTNGFTLTAFSSSVIRIFSGSVLISSSGTSYVNTWCHVAVTRVSGTFNLYINGVSQGTSATARTLSNTDAIVGGGRYGATGAVTTSFPGYIDDFRITKGIARYTSNFIPPSVALPRQ